MTKEELSNNLAELYGEYGGYEIVNENKYSDSITTLLIDDWNRLMPLSLEHDVWIQPYNSLGFIYAHARKDVIFDKVFYKDHESPEDAAKYAVAMALVKLAESKS